MAPTETENQTRKKKGRKESVPVIEEAFEETGRCVTSLYDSSWEAGVSCIDTH